jgi:hypothetical protein
VDVIPREAIELRTAYQRLTDKFRTLWVFQQFLQGLAAVLPSGGVAGTSAAFTPLYEQIKKVKEGRGTRQPADLLEEVERLNIALDGLHTTLLLEDRKVPPHVLRQFFERSGRDDDRELVPLLKFYFFARQLQPDDLDKVDFLLTRAGTQRLPDGGLELKPAAELAELCRAFLALTRREPTDPNEIRSVVGILEILRKDIEACQRFEDLIRKKPLENIRTLKRRMGNLFYSSEVLQALLASNVAAKRKFQTLYRLEEERILSASQHLLELEAELTLDPRFQTEEFQAEFRRFKRERDDFEKQARRRGVRPRDVRRLKEAIHRILLRVEPAAAADFDATLDTTSSGTDSGRGARRAAAAPAPSPARPDPARAPAQPPPPAAAPPPSAALVDASWRAEDDPLTRNEASKILHSTDLLGYGVGPGRAATSEILQSLKLEPWEVRTALSLARQDETPSRSLDPLTRLLFNAAALRLRMDEYARELRVRVGDSGGEEALPVDLAVSSKCLERAQGIDWQFRAALQEAAMRGDEEGHLQLTRSRFRHLRAYAGLWLLHNALGG